MADTLQNLGVNRMAQYILGGVAAAADLRAGLYVGGAAAWAGFGVDLGSLVELSATGYARIALVYANWILAYSSGVLNGTYPPITFTMSDNGGGQVVYGHFIYDNTYGHILWGANWATPWAIPSGGGVAVLYPTWEDKNC